MPVECLTYVRFVVGMPAPNSGVPDGVFFTAGMLRDDPTTAVYDAEVLAELLGWFNEELPEPVRLNRTNSKARGDRVPKGICWFKPTAITHISKVREMKVVLEANNYVVSQITTKRPGYAVAK